MAAMAKQRDGGALLKNGTAWGGLSPVILVLVVAAGCRFHIPPIGPLPAAPGAAAGDGALNPGSSGVAPGPGPGDMSTSQSPMSAPDLAMSATNDMGQAPPSDLSTPPDLTPPGPVCLPSCAECEAGKCCTDDCQGQSCNQQLCTGCSCTLTCEHASGGCNFICRGGSTCVATASLAAAVLVCTDGASCDLHCDAQQSCSAICNIDSTCIVRCGKGKSCNLQCGGTQVDCGNGVKVCNGSCPP
jgi:hypothetical protein